MNVEKLSPGFWCIFEGSNADDFDIKHVLESFRLKFRALVTIAFPISGFEDMREAGLWRFILGEDGVARGVAEAVMERSGARRTGLKVAFASKVESKADYVYTLAYSGDGGET